MRKREHKAQVILLILKQSQLRLSWCSPDLAGQAAPGRVACPSPCTHG